MSGGPPTETFGPYLVYEQLGVGGMASVHRAESRGIEGFRQTVALKRMLPHIAANEDLVKSFVREARLASHLRHNNVAQTFDLGRVDDIYFIAMELITGRDLRQILRKSSQTSTPIPVPVTLNILNQVCDALDYAHNLRDESGTPLGIIHRDVSPSNIIVSDGGVVKLIDFGIAKASAAGMQTMSGTLKGKFGYMAPEYIRGSIDARADLFALGVIAYELLTSKPLFSGRDDLDTLNRVQEMVIAPPSTKNREVPHEIDDVVMTALARDPSQRWQHATALRTAMTTLTHRLGLVIHNSQVVEWVSWLFDQTGKAPSTDPDPHISIRVDSDVSYTPSVEEVHEPITSIAPPEYRQRAQSSAPPINRTSTMRPASGPQITIPTDDEYRAAVERFSQSHAIPSSPSGPISAQHARVSGPHSTLAGPPIDLSMAPTTLAQPFSPLTPLPAMADGAPTIIDMPISPSLSGAINHTLLDRPVRPASSPSVQLHHVPQSSQQIRPPSGPMVPPSAPNIRATELGLGSHLMAPAPQPLPPRNLGLLAVMIVIAAIVAASVVYFVLPLLT